MKLILLICIIDFIFNLIVINLFIRFIMLDKKIREEEAKLFDIIQKYIIKNSDRITILEKSFQTNFK